MGGANAELGGSPRTMRCDPPPVPMPTGGVVRRHVPGPDVLAAWGWSGVDVAPFSDAVLDAIPDGPDVVAAPDLVRGSADPAVYVLENRTLRHVPDPAALAAWRFDASAIRAASAAELDAALLGPPLLGAPLLAQGSGPEGHLVDAAPPRVRRARWGGGRDAGGGGSHASRSRRERRSARSCSRVASPPVGGAGLLTIAAGVLLRVISLFAAQSPSTPSSAFS